MIKTPEDLSLDPIEVGQVWYCTDHGGILHNPTGADDGPVWDVVMFEMRTLRIVERKLDGRWEAEVLTDSDGRKPISVRRRRTRLLERSLRRSYEVLKDYEAGAWTASKTAPIMIQSYYTPEEAASAHAEISRRCEAGEIDERWAGDYKGIVTRRIARAT